jgi:DNA-directed RNA polymerase subunit RPC12/RpoP
MKLTRYQCLRCNAQWIPRKDSIPMVCPKCHSPYWRIPRKTKSNEEINKEGEAK